MKEKKPIIATATYTVKEAAKVTGIYWETIQKKATDGEIKTKFMGNRHIILGQSLLDWLNNSE